MVDRLFERLVPCAKPYVRLLDRLHQHLLPRNYIEIGVSTGRTLALALPGTVGIGIDPEPRINVALSRRSQVFPVTSDAFFASNDVSRLLGKQPLDLAFIDGMHHFEFALRDFINLERFAGPNTTILVHDCYPIDAQTAARDRTTTIWSGDIWKLIVCLSELRPDLRVSVVDVAPTGLGIVRGLDSHSTVLADNYDDIVDRYQPMGFDYFDEHEQPLALHRMADDWKLIEELLPAQPFRQANVNLLKSGRALIAAQPLARRALRRGRRMLGQGRRPPQMPPGARSDPPA